MSYLQRRMTSTRPFMNGGYGRVWKSVGSKRKFLWLVNEPYCVFSSYPIPRIWGKALGVFFLTSTFCILACGTYCVTVGFCIRNQCSETGSNAQGCKGSFRNEIQMPVRLSAGVTYRKQRELKAGGCKERAV